MEAIAGLRVAVCWLALAACGGSARSGQAVVAADAGTPQAPARDAPSHDPPPRLDPEPPPTSALAGTGGIPAHMPGPAGGVKAPRTAGLVGDPRVPPEVAQHAQDWPLPNHDYAHSRKADTHIDSSNIAQLREAYRVPIERGTTFGYVTGNPLIMGERVYFQDMLSNVYALERGTGKLQWKRSYEQPSFGPNGVAIGWGKLYATASDSRLVALDLQSGAVDLFHRDSRRG